MADDAITSEALALLTQGSARGIPPSSAAPVELSSPRRRGAILPGLQAIDSVASLLRHKCLRYLTAMARIDRLGHQSETYWYDVAIADRSKMSCLEDDRRRREIRAELEPCTFQPQVSKAVQEMQREKVNFHSRGLEWLKHRETKLEKKRIKEREEREQEVKEQMKLFELSPENRKLAAKLEGGERSTVRRTYEPDFDFHPAIASPPDAEMQERVAARGPVFKRLTQRTPADAAHLLPAAAETEVPRLHRALSPHEIATSVHRLHYVAQEQRRQSTKEQATKDRAMFPFQPQLNSNYTRTRGLDPRTAFGGVPSYALPKRPAEGFTNDELDETVHLFAHAPAFTKGQANEFFSRQENWWLNVRERREQLLREKEAREVSSHPFSPAITRTARIVGRSWGLDESVMTDARRPRATTPTPTKGGAKGGAAAGQASPGHIKVLPYRPAATACLKERVRDSTESWVTPTELKQWFDRLDAGRMGLIHRDLAVEAILLFAEKVGLNVNPIDPELEFSSRICFSDFGLLLARLVPN